MNWMYRPGWVQQVPDALSRLEYPQEAGKHAEVDDGIPCFADVTEYISSQPLVVTLVRDREARRDPGRPPEDDRKVTPFEKSRRSPRGGEKNR